MKHLKSFVVIFLNVILSIGLLHASTFPVIEKSQLADTYTKENCGISDGLRVCKVSSCEEKEGKELCLLRLEYACDIYADCYDSHVLNLDKADIDGLFYGKHLYELTSYCSEVEDCKEVNAACNAVGGDFSYGMKDPDSGAPASGHCYIANDNMLGYEPNTDYDLSRFVSNPDPLGAVGCDWDPASGICSWKIECSEGGGDECGQGTSGDDFCDCHSICGDTPAPCAGDSGR